MIQSARLVVGAPEAVDAVNTLVDLVMAWAVEAGTGRPCHIGELDEQRRGARCACLCPSCGEALIAVNAAREHFRRRPHFRHQAGWHNNTCAVLAARAAVLRALADEGQFELPGRTRSASWVGLSGQVYLASASVTPRRVSLREVDFRDRTQAVLTLDDGRQLHVSLTGTVQCDPETGALLPTIYVDLDDPELATLDPQALRERLRLVPPALCWRSAWMDKELDAVAAVQARAQAEEGLDAGGSDGSGPEDLDGSPALSDGQRRESLLHAEVKAILRDARRLAVPEHRVVERLERPGFVDLVEGWSCPPSTLKIVDAELERRFGRVVPDVVCRARADDASAFEPLFIEVTVTNTIDEARMDRIRAQGVAALEIDLSVLNGRITRQRLRTLVVDEVHGKRWLHHPEGECARGRVIAELGRRDEERVQQRRSEEARWQRDIEDVEACRRTPIALHAAAHLAAVEVFLALDIVSPSPSAIEHPPEWTQVQRTARALEIMGFRGADEAVMVQPHGMLARLLSIRHDRVVGYRMKTVFEVLNAIRQMRTPDVWPLYLLAAAVYRPKLDAERQRWLDEWRDVARSQLKSGELKYRPVPRHILLLKVLFPELTDGLNKLEKNFSSLAQRARRAATLPMAWSARSPANLDPHELSPAEREAWARQHPDAVRDWPVVFGEGAAAAGPEGTGS